MYESIEFHIRGVSPLLLHNGQLANPLNEFSKALKEVSSKRQKQDSDHIEMQRIEFLGGLYLNDAGHPAFPGENIESAMIAGCKKNKLGNNAKAGIICDGIWPIIYDGPKKSAELYTHKGFVDTRGVKLNGKVTIMRTRPIFRKWELKFTIQFLPDQLNRKQVVDAMVIVGRQIGFGDYKPKFGRFEVVEAK